MRNLRHASSCRSVRLFVCFASVFCITTAVPAFNLVSIAEWSFTGVASGVTSNITASSKAAWAAVSTLTVAGGTNGVGVVTAPYGLNKASGSDPFLAPAYEIGMITTTTTLNNTSFSLNFNVTAQTNLLLSHLTFDLGYDTDYNLSSNYYEPSARLYVSTNGTVWTAVAGIRTPVGVTPSDFDNRTGGAYFVEDGIESYFPVNSFYAKGTKIYFRLSLAENPSSQSNRRRIVMDNIKLRAYAGVENVQHFIAYHNSAEFAGWPANGGLWRWGEELLVGFERWGWTNTPPPDQRHHNTTNICSYYARSYDGGLSWIGEDKQPNVTPASSYNFQATNFAIRLWQGNYFLSNNRADTWGGPIVLPETNGLPNYARSNYIITGTNTAMLFISTEESGTNWARSYAAKLTQTATNRNVQILSWVCTNFYDAAHGINHSTTDYNHSIMPSAVRISGDHYVCAVRQRVDSTDERWAALYKSTNGCTSWTYLSEIERGSDNPIALVSLGGNTIAAIYGWRQSPYGLRSKISYNAGQTWSNEFILRDDGLNDDIGYARATVRDDGAIVILYYYATANFPQQHIAATIWRPQ